MKTPDKRQPESAAAQREEPWSERNTREIQQREVDSKKRQVGIQPSGSRSPGSGYGSERPGQKQSLLCRFGRAQDSVLHCREDTGPKSRDNGKRYCCCTVCLLSRLVKTITRDWGTEFANWRRLAPYGRTVALRGLLYRPVLRLAERRKRESERSASGVLSQRQEPFPCCPRHIKTRPGVVERQASQSSVLPFCSGIMGLRAQFLLHLV